MFSLTGGAQPDGRHRPRGAGAAALRRVEQRGGGQSLRNARVRRQQTLRAGLAEIEGATGGRGARGEGRAMISEFDDSGIRFKFPENWKLEREENEDGW